MGTLKKPRKENDRSSEVRAFYTLNHRDALGWLIMTPAIPRFESSGVSKRAPSKFRLIRSTWVSPVSKFRPLPWFFGTFWLWFFPGAVIVIFFLSFFALFFLSALTFMIVVTPAAATVGAGQGATRIRRAPTAPYSTTGWASEGVQLKC